MIRSAGEHRLSPLFWPALASFALATGSLHAWLTVLAPDAARFSFDSAQYALAGRTWLATGRLATPFVHPALVGDLAGPPWPLLAGQPLVPGLDALAFALFGATPDATLAPALLAFVGATLLTARLAWGLTSSALAAATAGMVFATTPWALGFAVTGMTEMPFACLLAAILVLLWETPEHPRPARLGLLLALAHLTRPVLLPLLPALMIGFLAITPAPRRIPALLRVALGFVPLVLVAGLLQTLSYAGAHPGSTAYLLLTGLDPGFTVARLNRMLPPPDALEWLRAHPAAFAAKFEHNVRALAYAAWSLGGRWPGVLALVAGVLALRSPDARARVFVLTGLGAATTLVALSAATVADPRMLFPLLGLTIALAVAGLVRITEAVGRGRRAPVNAALLAALLVGAVPLAAAWHSRTQRPVPVRERDWRGVGLAVRAMLPRAGVVASDAAPWIAWHTDRAVTLVPLAPDDLAHMPAPLRPAAVVLTDEWLVRRPGEERWRHAFETRTPPTGFVLAGHARSGALGAVVFVRDDVAGTRAH